MRFRRIQVADFRGTGSCGVRVLAVHRHFWPDSPPYASLLLAIVRHLAAEGLRVDVLSGQPSYKTDDKARLPRHVVTPDGIAVTRLLLRHEAGRPVRRIANAAKLGWSIVWRAGSGRYDVVMVSTMPPVVPGMAARIGCRISRTRLVYHCMDLHPEIGGISGEFRNPLVYRALLIQDAATCRRANPVVVLSDDMAASVRARPGCADADVVVINNFALPDHDGEAVDPLPPTDRLRVLFAGNVGRFQGLETVVEAMHIVAGRGRSDIEFAVMGTGVALAELERSARSGPGSDLIRFSPHQPASAAKAAMRGADVGLVALVPGIYRYAYPSKTMTYLEQGCPVMALVESESELARSVVESGVGWAIDQGQPEALADLLEGIADDRTGLGTMAPRATQYAREHFDQDRILSRWSAMLSEGGRSGRQR